MQMKPPIWQKGKRTKKELMMKVKEENEKVDLKT